MKPQVDLFLFVFWRKHRPEKIVSTLSDLQRLQLSALLNWFKVVYWLFGERYRTPYTVHTSLEGIECTKSIEPWQVLLARIYSVKKILFSSIWVFSNHSCCDSNQIKEISQLRHEFRNSLPEFFSTSELYFQKNYTYIIANTTSKDFKKCLTNYAIVTKVLS